jgi:hypothetical protein
VFWGKVNSHYFKISIYIVKKWLAGTFYVYLFIVPIQPDIQKHPNSIAEQIEIFRKVPNISRSTKNFDLEIGWQKVLNFLHVCVSNIAKP